MAIPATLSSVPSTTPYIQYVATSGQTVFDYPFPITQDSDLIVVANGVTLATDSGYTTANVGTSTGGSITFTSGRAAGDIITLYRDIPIERLTQIAQNSGFNSTAFNAEFNNIYLLLQQLSQDIDQCLQVPNTNNPAPTTSLTPASYANKYLAFDGNGNPTPAQLTTSGTVTQALIAGLLLPETSGETSAGVTPANYAYPPLDVRRYGADPTGTNDSTSAFNDLIAVLLAMGGGAAVVPPGTYKITSSLSHDTSPSTGSTAITNGIVLIGYGVYINYTGSGWAFDWASTNAQNGTAAHPLVGMFGFNIVGTSSGGGGIRLSDCVTCVIEDCKVQGFTAGTAYALRNTVHWCENNRFVGDSAIDCKNGMSFSVSGSSYTSFSRTYVEHFFQAGITGNVFDIGGTCAVYDSRFTHISGNFGGVAYFAIGAASNPADMTGTVVDGIDCEVSGAVSGQCVFWLRDYPQNSGTHRRPVVYNISPNATYTGSSNFPVWANASGSSIGGPESAQAQGLTVYSGPIQVQSLEGAALQLSAPAASTQVFVQYTQDGTVVAEEGVAGNSGDIITGSAAGDMCFRNASTIRFSVNGGTSSQLEIDQGTGDVKLSNGFAINGNVVPTLTSGWGTPTGNSVAANFSGSSATLPETSAAVAELIAVLKGYGFIAA